MFKIYDGRDKFYQWDLDRKLIVADKSIKQVHFCNRLGECSLVRNTYEVNGVCLVDVPNIILQNNFDVKVYGFDANYTKHSASYNVEARTRPENYVYTDTELKTWEQLEERIDQIEESGVSEEQITEAVKEYLDENPIEVPEPDLTDYYNKAETDAAIEQAVAAIEIPEPDMSEYAKKADIPDTTGFIKMSEVEAKGYQTEAQVLALINANMPADASEVSY